jgi:hypothetical protein
MISGSKESLAQVGGLRIFALNEPSPDKSGRLNWSMQHHLISWSDNTSSRETICKALLCRNLNRAVFCLHQRP